MKRQIILSALVITLVLSFPIFSWAECQADLNNDGDVDAEDLSVVASEFGKTSCVAGNYLRRTDR